MKTLFLILTATLIFTQNYAQASDAVLTCKNIEILNQDEDGKANYTKSDFSVVIEKTATGYKAKISSYAGVNITTDVAVNDTAPASVDNVKDMTALMAPNVRWSDVSTVRVGNVGVKANSEDAGGIYVYELQSAEQKTLAKLVTIGWGFGRCEK